MIVHEDEPPARGSAVSVEGPSRQETPRVVRRLRILRRTTGIRSALDPVRGALTEAERRFLSLQSAAVARPSAEVLAEYLAILNDLRGIDQQLREASGRRDIPFIVDRRLAVLNDHCRWLTRRVSGEVLLALEIQLEQELRRVIAPEAYQLFLRLEEVEDTAREIETMTDRDLMARLQEGALVREVLEQVRLGDVIGASGGADPGAVE